MYINELPEVVLANIFDWYSVPIFEACMFQSQFSMWRPRLELLKVCRIWRKLALPIVHREIFISCTHKCRNGSSSDIEESGASSLEESNQSESDDGQTKVTVVKTNLDIIDSTSKKRWPRILQIYAGSAENKIAIYREIVHRIYVSKNILDRVNFVDIDMDIGGIDTDSPAIMDEVFALGRGFCHIVPSVQYLYIGSVYNIQVAPNFLRSLVSGYANKLKSLKCPHWVLENMDRVSEKPTHIEVDSIMDAIHIKITWADSLKVTSLDDVKNDLTLRPTESESNPGVVSFSDLSTLVLYAVVDSRIDDDGAYEWVYPANEFSYKIYTPRLKKVDMMLCPHTLSMLSSIQGLSILKYVELPMDAATIRITGLNVEKARHLFSRYAKRTTESYETVDAFSYAHDILSIDGLAEHTQLTCLSMGDTFDIEQVDWKYLDELEVICLFKITELPLLLSKLPRLKTIQINMLELRSSDGCIAEILDPEAVVEPIESAITGLYVGLMSNYTDKNVDMLERYLSKLLPNTELTVI